MRKFTFCILFIASLLLVGQFTFYTPEYLYRVLVWQDADYDDFKKFDFKTIKKSENPFKFHQGTKNQRQEAKAKFEQNTEVFNLDTFLKEKKTYSFLVIQNDTLMYESYFLGNNRASWQTSFSTSKSVLSILVGIAIDEAKIQNINDPITKYIPELEQEDTGFKKITIKHLLMMQSGISFVNKTSFPFVNGDSPKTYYHPDLRRVAIKHSKIEGDAGEVFKYNNYNALLIGLLVERATGQSVAKYLEQKLWKKIGTEYDASWSIDKNDFEKMESGLNVRSIDFAKIGRLVLNHGSWENSNIVSPEWIAESTQQKIDSTYQHFGDPRYWTYNYFWWGFPQKKFESDVMAIGRFGQFIYISPNTNTIIVRNGEEVENFGDRDWIALFRNFTE